MANEKGRGPLSVLESDPKLKPSSSFDYLENKQRLTELERLEGELTRELEANYAESVEAMILGHPFDLAQISSAEAQLGLTRRAIGVLEKRIESFRRGEFR